MCIITCVFNDPIDDCKCTNFYLIQICISFKLICKFMYVNCRDCLDPLVPWGPQALTADGGTLVSRALKERKETMAEEALWVQKEVW